jgi:hypothetical protein
MFYEIGRIAVTLDTRFHQHKELLAMILGIVLAFFLGILGGGLLAYFYLNGSSSEEKLIEIKALKKDQKEYREKVDAHFAETAGLFKDLTDKYRDVYKHMATGADALCSDEAKQLQVDMSNSGLLIEAAAPSEEESEVTEESLPTEEIADSEAPTEIDVADVNIDDVLAEQHAAQTELENDKDPATLSTERDAMSEAIQEDDVAKVLLSDDDLPLASEVEAAPEKR